MGQGSVGIDLVEVERIASVVERWGQRFLARVYTPEEVSYCLRKNDPYPSLAARFAAKEAFVKALSGLGGGAVSLRDVEVVRQEKGPPQLRLGVRRECLEGKAVSVSLTHTQDHAAACVLISETGPGAGR
jgi:holo-[acyl-carrier protein] synthase